MSANETLRLLAEAYFRDGATSRARRILLSAMRHVIERTEQKDTAK